MQLLKDVQSHLMSCLEGHRTEKAHLLSSASVQACCAYARNPLFANLKAPHHQAVEGGCPKQTPQLSAAGLGQSCH